MSNILEFKPTVVVEISFGEVTASYIEDATGRHPNPNDIGRTMFFVVVVDTDGTRMGMWSGESRTEAKIEAEECKRDFRGVIRDLTMAAA